MLKIQRLQELLTLLIMAETAERAIKIDRAVRICIEYDRLWWEQHGDAKTAEELITYFNPPSPRLLPPLPYEELP